MSYYDWKSGASKNGASSGSWSTGGSAGYENTKKAISPYGSYYFALEIDKEEVGHFMECTGLKSTCEVFEIQEGGLNGRVHKFPGQSRWENITLRIATSASTRLFEWRDKFLQDQFTPENKFSGCIKIMDNDGEIIRRYEFTKAWPVSWEGPGLNSGGSELAIETLEIAHDGLVVKNA